VLDVCVDFYTGVTAQTLV